MTETLEETPTAETPSELDEEEANLPDEQPETGDQDEDETGDQEEDDEPAPAVEDEEPEARQGLSEQELEKAAKRLDGAVGRYRKAVEQFIADTGQSLVESKMDLDFCPGYVFHPDVLGLNEEQRAFAKVMLGEPPMPAFEQDPQASECPRCHGWGQVKTGSKVATFNVLKCRECDGRGAVGERFNLTPQQAAVGVTPDYAADRLPAPPAEPEDPWGTPIGHPDHGKMPQYRDPGWEAALAAYKAGRPAPLT